MSTATAEPTAKITERPPVTVNRLPAYIPWNPFEELPPVAPSLWTREREMEYRVAAMPAEVVRWIEERARRRERRQALEMDLHRARHAAELAHRQLREAERAYMEEQERERVIDEPGFTMRGFTMRAADWAACCAPMRASIDRAEEQADRQYREAYQQELVRQVEQAGPFMPPSVSGDPGDAEPVSGGSEVVAGIVGGGDADDAGGDRDRELVELVAGGRRE
jgi:hypothetical protein